MRLSWADNDDALPVSLPDIEDFFDGDSVTVGEARLEKVVGKNGMLPKEAFPDFKLTVSGIVYESTADTNFKSYNRNAARWSTGNVLMVGLGLGVCLLPMVERRCVDSVTILEEEEDVAKLMGDFWLGIMSEEQAKKVKIVSDVKDINRVFEYAIFLENNFGEYGELFGRPCLVFHNNEIINAGLPGDNEFYDRQKARRT